MDKMIANGDTPLCVGIESGPATGWPFTDWVEELVLREQGIDYYNQWVAHEIPFNDQTVVDAFNEVAGPDGYWKKGNVFASGGSIAATAFGDNGAPLVEGKCMMHRQANFYSPFFPEGTKFGDGDGEVSTFYFPSDEGHPVLVGGISAGAFRDAPEVWKVMEYLGSSDFANATARPRRAQRVGGGLSGFLTGEHGRRHDQVGAARAGLHQGAPDRRPGRVRRRPTRCPPKSGRARSGRRARRSSTATRTPRRPRPTSRPRGPADRLRPTPRERTEGGAGGSACGVTGTLRVRLSVRDEPIRPGG